MKKTAMRISHGAGGDWVELTGRWEVSELFPVYHGILINDS
jgi:hypothetical protein